MPKHSFQRNGNITLVKLRKEDFGRYECVIENEIATLIASTEIRMNGNYYRYIFSLFIYSK